MHDQTGLTALIVEDEDSWYHPINEIVQAEFSQTVRKVDYHSALAFLQEVETIDLLVADLFIPLSAESSIVKHDGGFDLVRAAKVRHPNAAYIICSRRIGNEELSEAKAVGAIFVYKGDIHKELVAHVRRAAQQRRR